MRCQGSNYPGLHIWELNLLPTAPPSGLQSKECFKRFYSSANNLLKEIFIHLLMRDTEREETEPEHHSGTHTAKDWTLDLMLEIPIFYPPSHFWNCTNAKNLCEIPQSSHLYQRHTKMSGFYEDMQSKTDVSIIRNRQYWFQKTDNP